MSTDDQESPSKIAGEINKYFVNCAVTSGHVPMEYPCGQPGKSGDLLQLVVDKEMIESMNSSLIKSIVQYKWNGIVIIARDLNV